MIKKRRNANNCSIVNTSAELTDVLTKYSSAQLNFDEAQEKIIEIQIKHENSQSPTSFGEIFNRVGLQTEGFIYNSSSEQKTKQLAIESLNADNIELFRYRDTTKNKLDALFSNQAFRFLFVDLSKDFKGRKRFTQTKREFNASIVAWKNYLSKVIIDGLKINDLKDKEIFDRGGAIIEGNTYLYQQLMSSSEVERFVRNKSKGILDDPIANAADLPILQAIYALNNFDTLLETELQGLLIIPSNNKRLLNNVDYVKEISNNATEYWANDTHADKSLSNYTSNISKFIMKQIPKVIKTGSGQYKQIQGRYLTPSELYVLSATIKQAEFEYNLLHPDTPVSLSTNTVNSIYTLLQNRFSLPAFKMAKRELIDSIEAFLWAGTETTISVAKAFEEAYRQNQNILDIEGILAFEIYQSANPTYIEFASDGSITDRNHGGLYRNVSALTNGMTEFLFDQVHLKRRSLTKKHYNNGNPKTLDPKKEEDLKLLKMLCQDVLGLDLTNKEVVSEFIGQNLTGLNALAKELSLVLYGGKNSKGLADLKKDDLELYQDCMEQAKTVQSRISKEFIKNHSQLLSDEPVTQFDSFSGATIPVYRLNSALTNLSWFLRQYKQTNDKSNFNFLVDNPLLLTKYTGITGGKFSDEHNTYYKGYANYILGVGDSENYQNFAELPPADQLQLLFLYNVTNEKRGLFTFQPVCYSDKTSIGTITLNLETKFKKLGDINGAETTFSELLASTDGVTRIRQIDYKYRKNSTIKLIDDILRKWHTVFSSMFPTNDLSSIQPLTEKEWGSINNRLDLAKNIYNLLNNKLDSLSQLLQKNEIKDHFPAIIARANSLGIELIDNLDYVKKSGQYTLNPALIQDFQMLKDFKTFAEEQSNKLENFFQSEEYKQFISGLKDRMLQSDLDEDLQRFLNQFFKKEWMPDKKRWKVSFKPGAQDELKGIYAKQTALANLGRHSILDLVSKFWYLDPSKTDIAELEKAKSIDAMAKRMVLYPATIQNFQQGLINGVSHELKAAVIEDAKEPVWNISGDDGSQDIYDGSGYLSPYQSMMEDNSLPGHGVHGTKKTLGVSTRGHNSVLFKWAAYPITNEKMRNSMNGKFSLLKLYKKMHDRKWDEDIDITKSFLGTSQSIPSHMINKSMYISDGLDYYQIEGLWKLEEANTYELELVKVGFNGDIKLDKDGNRLTTTKFVEIRSIYDLWEALGGVNSMSLIDGELQPSEASIEAAFQYIINTGSVIDPSRRYDQNNVRQPLRDKFIGIVANKSAVKRGASNINTAKSAWETDSPLTTFIINTANFGIQLDANHHTDLSEVREMSQTISTLASSGRTAHLADEAYAAIGALVDDVLKKLGKFNTIAEQKGLEESLKLISKKLVNRLARETKIASTDAFIDMFSVDMETLLPISDRAFYKLFVKDILETLNKSAIKRKYTGLGAILNPASNIMQVYDLHGQQMVFSTVLKLAKRDLNIDMSLRNALYAKINMTKEDKDIVLVYYYMWKIYNPNMSFEELWEKAIANTPLTQPVDVMNVDSIKPLDTVRYKLSTDTEWQELTLDSLNNLIKFQKIVEKNTNYSTGTTDLEIEKFISKPHDLRPQSITWKSYNQENGVIVTRPHSIYTTIASRLSQRVGQKENLHQTQIETALAELAEAGRDLQHTCNN